MRGNCELKLQNSPKLLHIHARFHCNANEQLTVKRATCIEKRQVKSCSTSTKLSYARSFIRRIKFTWISLAPSTIRRRNLKTEVSLWNRIKCFPSTLSRRNQKNITITDHFSFVFEENSSREITWLSWRHRSRNAPFSKCFLSTLKRKSDISKFLRFVERFRKASFSWRISVNGRPNSGSNAAFSHFYLNLVFFFRSESTTCLVNYLQSQVNSFDTCACDKSSDD